MELKKIRFPFFATKRSYMSTRNMWIIKIFAVLLAFLLSGIIAECFSPGNFLNFYSGIFNGTFGNIGNIMALLCCFSVYLILSLAVTPAFKMKFWNIGIEGQAMTGCTISAIILLLMPNSIPPFLVILIALIASIVGGIIWAAIPTIFKVKFNTNETLFTLMMNYVATALAATAIAAINPSHPDAFPTISSTRTIIKIGTIKYIPIVIVALLLLVLLYFYIKKTKHGFELSVVGDSRNTARYIGMKTSWVAIRTMILSGGIAGLCGFLLVCGRDGSLSVTSVGGQGFTAVLISWLGYFNPTDIAVCSFLIAFFDQGCVKAASNIGVSTIHFSGVIVGLTILIIVTSEFFIRYKVNVREEFAKKITAKMKRKGGTK